MGNENDALRAMLPIVQAKVKNVVKNKSKWTPKELGSTSIKIGAIEFSYRDIISFSEIFALVDKDKSGQISAEEVKYLMNLLGNNISLMEVDGMITEYDLDQSGEVDLTEFLFVIASQRRTNYSKADILRAFDMFAKETGSRHGAIQRDTLTTMLCNYGKSVASRQEIEKLVATLPLTVHGEFDYAKHVSTFMSST